MLHVQAPIACKYDKSAAPGDIYDTGRFSLVAKKGTGVQVLLHGGEHSVLPLLGFSDSQFDSGYLSLPLVAANPADIDRDHPVAAQRVRSDTNFADKFSRFNGRFGTRMKRAKTSVGELVPRFGGKSKGRKATQGGEAKPIFVQDGHLCAFSLCLSLGWHMPSVTCNPLLLRTGSCATTSSRSPTMPSCASASDGTSQALRCCSVSTSLSDA